MGVPRILAEIDGGTISYQSSLFCMIEPSLKNHPANLAVAVAHQEPEHLSEFIRDLAIPSPDHKDISCLAWTYAEVQYAALKIVSSLRQRGLQPGSTIVTIIPNGIEWAILWWSSMLGKYALCPIDFGALNEPRAAELQDLLNRVQPDAIVVPGTEGAAAVDAALSLGQGKPNIVKISLSLEPDGSSWLPFRAMATQPLEKSLATRITLEAQYDDLDRMQLICFTSGTTTGRPKGCPRTARSTMHTGLSQTWGSHHDATSRNLLQTQNFRIIAPTIALSTWMRGGCIVMPSPSFSPSHILQAIESHRVRVILLIPAMVHALTAHPAFATTDLRSLKTVLIGGDMVTQDLYTKTCSSFPHCEVIPSHGMTEGGGAFGKDSFTGPGLVGAQPIPFYAAISPLGKVNEGTRLRIADDRNAPVKRNEIGELQFCSDSFVTRYLDDEKPEDFYTDPNGRSWFKRGDRGMINDEGWVYILGRKKDIIKRAGVPITPAALESCIDAFLGSSSSVIGLEDAVLGQVPFAIVQDLNPPKTKADVEKQVIEMFGKDYALMGVATLKEIGLTEWPVNATGKIVKRTLEEPVMSFLHRVSEK